MPRAILFARAIFDSYDDTVAPCCEAWNRLTDQP
jgi:hypothetical protein